MDGLFVNEMPEEFYFDSYDIVFEEEIRKKLQRLYGAVKVTVRPDELMECEELFGTSLGHHWYEVIVSVYGVERRIKNLQSTLTYLTGIEDYRKAVKEIERKGAKKNG